MVEVKFSMAKLANEFDCPKEVEVAKDNYVPIEQVIDKEIEIVAFAFIVSTNLEKYNQGNEEAVHFAFKVGDELQRTSTHSKRLVKGFHALEKATGTKTFEVGIPTKIVKKVMPNTGRTMFDFDF